MGVRLNKVLSELNIGLQTAVDFLKKKSDLGEVKDDATPNTKISDEQYAALVNEFSTDKAVKTQAEQLFTKKQPKEKKVEKPAAPEKAVTKSDELLEQRPQFKTLGKIDLSTVGKPKATPDRTPQADHQVEEPEPEVEKVADEEPVVTESAVEPQQAPAEAEVEPEEEFVVDETADDNVDDSIEDNDEAEDSEEQGPELAKTPGDAKVAQNVPQLNVLGKIDLSTLNQSTRPKKKSKEERRKEREEKAAGERKKRERIRQGKVDIEAAAKQASQQNKNNNKNGNNNGKNNNQQQQ